MNLFSKRMIRLLSLTTATMVMLNVVGCNMAGPKTPSPGTKQQATPKTQSVPNAPRALTAAKKLTPVIGELPNKPPKQRVELKSKRSKFSTRYLNPNGTFTEEIYNVPQYYLDSTDKTFKPIDNTLKVRGNNKHENTAGDLHVVLSDTVSSDELVSAEFAGTSVALVPVNGKSGVKGTVKGNSITYPNLFPNADVKYDVQGNVLKESIVLTSSAAANTYSFELRTNGLTASTDAKGKIVLTNAKKKQVYSFAKPYMVDATGRSSSKVTYALRTAAGHTYIDVTADSAFLKDPATKYPVVVDPTLNTWDTLQDTFVSSTQPSVAFGSGTTLYTGNDPTYGTTRSLVQFFLPSLPSDAKISTATISLYQTKSSATNTAIDMYRATSAWSNSTTWSNQPTIGTTADGTTTNNATNAYWTWTITNLAKDWYNGVSPNYGVELRQQSEATTASRVFNQLGAITNTPRLSITYTVDPMGMESYWGTTKDLVNPANGNLMLQETDLNVPGRGEPMAVARTYNSRKATAAGLFGYGWWSNLDSRLVDSGSGPITLIDDDGTRHIFGQKIGGGYEEPGGAGLVLVKNPDNTYTLTQPDNTASTYNTAGRLATSTDANGNVMKYTYDTNGRLTTITDPSGRTSAVTYGTNGYVATITDPATHVWKYEYDASNNLSRVLDPASNPMSFTYDTAHKMLTFTDRKGTVTTFVYDTSDRVSTISRPLTSGGTTSSGTTTMTYDTTNLVTTETDYEGKRTDYSYNANGNLTQITQNPTDAANKSVITYAYDNNNRLTQTKDPLSVNSNGTGYVYNYDANGNITSAQLPDNQVATYTYDAKNNMATATDFNNNVNQFAYDARNNQTEAVDPRAQAISSRYTSNGTLSYTAQPMAAADNYVSNSSFELDTNSDNWPDHWVQATETGKTATFAWSTTSRFGGKSVTITNPTGWAIISNDVYVPYTAGDVYAVSGYLKT
ncbi:MAG: DNRLRE domain-containing protein, partial [Tumebacillaceae bacterium]